MWEAGSFRTTSQAFNGLLMAVTSASQTSSGLRRVVVHGNRPPDADPLVGGYVPALWVLRRWAATTGDFATPVEVIAQLF